MFAVDPAILRHVIGWHIDSCGSTGSDAHTDTVVINMTAELVALQTRLADMIVATTTIPRASCVQWKAPTDTDIETHHYLPLRAFKTFIGATADVISVRLPCAAAPDHFLVELRTRAGAVLSCAQVKAMCGETECTLYDTSDATPTLAATFQQRELQASVSQSRALGLEFAEFVVTGDKTLELRSASSGSTSVSQYSVTFTAVDDPVLFSGGNIEPSEADDAAAPRVKRRGPLHVERIPNTVLDMQCNRDTYKPQLFTLKFFERLLARASFCSRIRMAVLADENMCAFRLDFVLDADARVSMYAIVATAIRGVVEDD